MKKDITSGPDDVYCKSRNFSVNVGISLLKYYDQEMITVFFKTKLKGYLYWAAFKVIITGQHLK